MMKDYVDFFILFSNYNSTLCYNNTIKNANMNIIEHLFGLCGESHLNIYLIIFLIIILKINFIFEYYENIQSRLFRSYERNKG